MSFLVPEDAVLVGLWDRHQQPAHVDSVPNQLREILRRTGFAEIHLHLGASVTFPDLWSAVARQIGSWKSSRAAFKSPCGVFCDGAQLADWLIRAMISRFLISEFLHTKVSENFAGFLRETYQRIRRRNGVLLSNCVKQAFEDLLCGRLNCASEQSAGISYRDLQNVYRQLVCRYFSDSPFVVNASANDGRKESLRQFRAYDPISCFFPARENVGCEMQFMHACFERLQTDGEGPQDELLEACFWQYFRVRNIYYGHVVHDPCTPGLSSFIRSYNRIFPALHLMSDRAKFESAADVSGKKEGLVSLEVRIAPGISGTNYLNLRREYWQSRKDLTDASASKNSSVNSLSEVGLVMHFIRNRGKEFENGSVSEFGLRTNADPAANTAGYRFGHIFKRFRSEANNLISLLRAAPELLTLVRGIDACNDENAIPLWVVIPHMRSVVVASRSIASKQARLGGIGCVPLRTTLHVGEDFSHLQTGLRRVGEALDHLNLRETDRLGHAIALGLDVDRWSARHPLVFMASEDRLWDLVWELGLYSRNEVTASASRIKFVESCILQLTESMLPSEDLCLKKTDKLYRQLFQIHELEAAGYPDGNGVGRRTGNEALRAYLTRASCFKESKTAVTVETQAEIASLQLIQGHLLERVASRRIVVEVNPSSNLSVASLSDLKYHPVIRFSGLASPTGSIDVAIGSDDPLCFAASLTMEYSLLLDALANAGIPPVAAMDYLKRRCEVGLECRFTLPTPST